MFMKKWFAGSFPQFVGRALVALLGLLLVACASASTSTVAPAHSTSTPLQSTPESTPAAEPTAGPGSVVVYVSLVEFHISSSVTVFRAGTPYHFVITNRGHDIHEFMIMPDKPDGSPLPPDVQYKGMVMELEPIMPGTTWTTNYTFAPGAVGRYEIACQMRGHYKAGMRLPIVVSH
jgi:uncharacterized cupredoxin-like copper-binding protein